MTRLPRPLVGAGLLVASIAVGCSSAVQSPPNTGVQSGSPAIPRTPAEKARLDGGKMAYTRADVHFMQGMIHHHAQAVIMAGWAQTHDARPDVKTLAGRIDVAQRDEMAFMQRWLRERHEDVPDPLEHMAM